MKLSELGSRHYTDDEIENITKNLFEVGSSSYANGEVVHTSYGCAMEQLKMERDEEKALGAAAFRDCLRITAERDEAVNASIALAETLGQTLKTHDGHIRRLRDCALFFSSVIKSGEPWTEECEESLKRALAKEWSSDD
jgi:hypothetical protein